MIKTLVCISGGILIGANMGMIMAALFGANREDEPVIKVKLEKGAFLPERAHEADAGLDLRSPIRVVLRPQSR